MVSGDYFRALQVPVLEGRSCRDDPQLAPVVGDPREPERSRIASSRMRARSAATSRQGPRTTRGQPPIVGVVSDVRERGVASQPEPMAYLCGLMPYWPDPRYLVRVDDPRRVSIAAIRAAIREIEPARAVYAARPLGDFLADAIAQPRLNAMLLSLFACDDAAARRAGPLRRALANRGVAAPGDRRAHGPRRAARADSRLGDRPGGDGDRPRHRGRRGRRRRARAGDVEPRLRHRAPATRSPSRGAARPGDRGRRRHDRARPTRGRRRADGGAPGGVTLVRAARRSAVPRGIDYAFALDVDVERSDCRYNCRVRLTSSAPTRIDLAGGTIDIWPLYLFHDGASTVNAAISLRAHVEVESRPAGGVELRSIDTDRTVSAPSWNDLDGAGDLALLALLARHYRLENATLTTRGESPAGAGIAGSSALTIAVCGALARWTGSPEDPEHLLQVAMNVECQTIRVPTGVQDYRPALYGGIASIELGVAGIRRVAIDVDPLELERRIVLAYTGAPRNSGHQQLGDHEAPHRRRSPHLRLLRADSRYRGGDADGARARRLGRGRPADRDRVGQPQAPGAGRHDADHRRPDRARDGRRRDGGQGLRRRRWRMPVLLRPACLARGDCRGAGRGRRAPARLPYRDRRPAAWITSRSRASSGRSRISSRSRTTTRSRFARTATAPTSSRTIPTSSSTLDETGLREIPGIGKDLAARIREIGDTGDTAYHRELIAEFPPTILDLLHLQGVGPKTVATLYRELGIRTSTISSARRSTAGFARFAAWARRRKR